MKFYLTLLTFTVIIAMSGPGNAYSSYSVEIPGELNGACIVCHEDTTGGPLNPYGVEYGISYSVDDIAAMDSDSDGFTNEEELERGFLPGDPTDFPGPKEKSNGLPGFGVMGVTIGILGTLLFMKGRGR